MLSIQPPTCSALDARAFRSGPTRPVPPSRRGTCGRTGQLYWRRGAPCASANLEPGITAITRRKRGSSSLPVAQLAGDLLTGMLDSQKGVRLRHFRKELNRSNDGDRANAAI